MKKAIYNYTAVFEGNENGGYTVTVPSLPGLVTEGRNLDNARIMATEAINQQILDKLARLEKEVGEIKEHMVDVDVILTEEERILLDKSLKHEKEGKLISFEEIENVRNKVR